MRISVNQLRALFLAINLVLAGSLLYKALAAYNVIDLVLSNDIEVESHPGRVELRNFVYVPEDFGKPRDPASQVIKVSSDLQPPPPKKPEIDKPEDLTLAEEEETPSTEEELPEGPLAKEWEYRYYIAWHGESGRRNFVQLKKKEEKNTSSSRFRRPVTNSRTRTSSSTRRPASTRTSRYSRTKKADSVSFLVSDREIENEEFDLHFWVHSADKEKLVYWMPGQPGKFYALPYKHEGSYLAQGPIRKELRPEKDEDEDEDEDGEKKKSFYIIQTDADPEAAREQAYQEILAGKSPESRLRPSGGTSSKSRFPSSSSKLSPSSGRRTPPKPTQEDIKELKDAINRIPAAEQAKLKKELQGMLQGKKK